MSALVPIPSALLEVGGVGDDVEKVRAFDAGPKTYQSTLINSTVCSCLSFHQLCVCVHHQILIVTSTAFAGVLLLNYQRDYAEWLLPLIIVCLFAFLVAHCFLSVFEIVVDVLFLCFAIDTKYNDGTPGKEFFMDKALMVSETFCRVSLRATHRNMQTAVKTIQNPAEVEKRYDILTRCRRLLKLDRRSTLTSILTRFGRAQLNVVW